MRRLKVLYHVSQIFSQESQTIADYADIKLVRKAKAAKIFKSFSPRWIFHKFDEQA